MLRSMEILKKQQDQTDDPMLMDKDTKVTLLCEIVGGSDIVAKSSKRKKTSGDDANNGIGGGNDTLKGIKVDDIQLYCTVRYSKGDVLYEKDLHETADIIHQTKRSAENGLNPIWTISTGSLFLVPITPSDIASGSSTSSSSSSGLVGVGDGEAHFTKSTSPCLYMTVWYKQMDPLQITTLKIVTLGVAKFNFLETIFPNLNEQRVDMDLYDVATAFPGSSSLVTSTTTTRKSCGKLTCRFRIATLSDIQFLGRLVNDPSTYNSRNKNNTNKNQLNSSSSTSTTTNVEESCRALHIVKDSINYDNNNNIEVVSGAGMPMNAKKTTSNCHRPTNLLVTEANEREKVGESVFNVLSSVFTGGATATATTATNNTTTSSTHNAKDGNKKNKLIRVKPGPDPNNIIGTEFLSKDGMKQEMMKPSHTFIPAGGCTGIGSYTTTNTKHNSVVATTTSSSSSSIGQLFLEILSCNDLPNVDVGEAVGNYTDCFVAAIYEDTFVETIVINDELNPIFMPWTQRAFIFNICTMNKFLTSHLYLGVFDYEISVVGTTFTKHTPLGRVAINLNHFQPHTEYTLRYNLYPTSNVTDRISTGSILIRLRIEYTNLREALWNVVLPKKETCQQQQQQQLPLKCFHVNVTKEKSLPVVRYTCYGMYGDSSSGDEHPFDWIVTRSYINEIFGYKAAIQYVLYDGCVSLLLWRGQVHILNNTTIVPLHSFCFFLMMTTLIEHPYLLPSFVCIGIGWILLALQTTRTQHPSPWHRCHSFWYYLHILLSTSSSSMNDNAADDCIENKNNTNDDDNNKCTRKKDIYQLYSHSIEPNEGADDAILYEKRIQERLVRDEKAAEHAATLQKKILEIGDDNIHTKKNLPPGLSLDLFLRLTRYQAMIGRYCELFRSIKLILTWEDSIMSFWITALFLGGGLVSLVLPWKFLLTWMSRIIVYGFFGPHMKLIDWILFANVHDNNDIDNEVQTQAIIQKMMDKFANEKYFARIRHQEAIKMQDIKSLQFGPYSTRIPLRNITRHYDRPLSESFARPVVDEDSNNSNNNNNKNAIASNNVTISSTLYIPGQQLYGAMIPRTEREMIVYQEEMEQLKSIEQSLIHTTKHIIETEEAQLIERLKTQDSQNDSIPDTAGYELISYGNNNTSNDDHCVDGTDNEKMKKNSNKTNDEMEVHFGDSATLSLNLKSSTVAVLHCHKNEGSKRRRSSTFRGGYELLPVVRIGTDLMSCDEDDEEEEDDDDENENRNKNDKSSNNDNCYDNNNTSKRDEKNDDHGSTYDDRNDYTSSCRITQNEISLRLGSASKTMQLDSKRGLAVVDTELQEEVNNRAHSLSILKEYIDENDVLLKYDEPVLVSETNPISNVELDGTGNDNDNIDETQKNGNQTSTVEHQKVEAVDSNARHEEIEKEERNIHSLIDSDNVEIVFRPISYVDPVQVHDTATELPETEKSFMACDYTESCKNDNNMFCLPSSCVLFFTPDDSSQ